MSRKHLKPRDKVTQRMTRDGVVLENQTTGEEINISDREAEQDFTPAGATGRAEKVLERADRAQERRSMKKTANKQPPAKPGVLHIRAKPWNTSLRVSSRKYDLPAAKNLLLAARKRA